MPKVSSSKSVPTEVVELVNAEVQYPELSVVIMTATTGGSVTVESAKELLGWQEETDDVKFGSDYLFIDLNDKKVRCVNNTCNRPFYESHAVAIAQDHLNRRWRLNGETLTIGKSGQIVSGQHRLISLILAEQTRLQDPEKWAANWPDEVTMDTIIVFGVEETDDVVNTDGIGKPRSLVDVLYRSKWFNTLPPRDRKAGARAADYAVRLLWDRTGAGDDAYSPTRTHAESMDFFDRHPSLIPECVKDIVTENGSNNSIGQYLSVGAASGLYYLMAASSSDATKYQEDRSEKSLVITKKSLGKAHDFFVALHGGATELNAAREAILCQADPDTLDGGATFAERIAILIKAWHKFSADEKVTPASVKLRYLIDPDDGSRVLNEFPLVGGIDLPRDSKSDEEPEKEVTVAEAANKVKEIRDKKGETPPVEPKRNDDMAKQIAAIRANHPERVLFFEAKDEFKLYDRDAKLATLHIGTKAETVNGLQVVKFKKNQLVPAHTALNEGGYSIATVINAAGEVKVTPLAPIAKKKKK